MDPDYLLLVLMSYRVIRSLGWEEAHNSLQAYASHAFAMLRNAKRSAMLHPLRLPVRSPLRNSYYSQL